jgi:hypothetical protein
MSNNSIRPLGEALTRAIRWFNYSYSLPKTWLSSCKVMLGFKRVGTSAKPLVITSSISEDYARLWLFFAQHALDPRQWDFLIIDSAGDMDSRKFQGCEVVRFLNIYHGRKIDILLRRLLRAEIVFLCDDDKYILQDVMPFVANLDDPQTPVVSLSPRSWWKFRINGEDYLPMGSHALVLKRSKWLRQGLRLQSPANLTSSYKVDMSNAKLQAGYDTADYANEQLLLDGYAVVTLPDTRTVLGSDDGLSAPRILLMKYGKAYVKDSLLQAEHYHDKSTNGTVMKTMYAIVKFERLYRTIFQEEPRLSSGFSEAELSEIVENNTHLDGEQRTETLAHFQRIDAVYQTLLEKATRPPTP